ncbi:MAG: flavodoxin family protein [Thermoleophilia bacterium]|nr:flavodoxin family protein [Thermoleophilia bacterium]
MGVTVLGIAGSARRGGNTETLLDWCLGAARETGADVVKFRLSDLNLHGCRACDACWKDGVCVVKDDMQHLYPYLREADSIVLAAPVYFMGMPAVPKMMIDRCQCLWAWRYVLGQRLVGPDRPRRLGGFLTCSGTTVAHAFDASRRVVQAWFHLLEASLAGEVAFAGVDAKGDIFQRQGAREAAEDLGRRLARRDEEHGS